ncbi:MAG: DUF4388 domain-containing protein [Acidimicrobiales bacterium]
MALQGTLDTFALPDVLRLLAATNKTGRLRLTGSRGTGSVWVTSGEVTTLEATNAPHATTAVDALFELLRFEDGDFTFDAEATHDAPGQSTDVEAILEQSEALLAEWRGIEAVVPSLDAWVTLRPSLPRPEVTVDQDGWTTIVAVGAGATVRRIGDDLCLSELPVSRAIKDLVDAALVEITDAVPATADPSLFTGGDASARPLVAPSAELLDPASAASNGPRARRAKGAAAPVEPEAFVPLDLPGQSHGASYDPVDDAPSEVPATEVDDFAAAFPGLAGRSAEPDDQEEAEEVATQLASLSPRAASAIRAAAEAETGEEGEATLDAYLDGEEPPLNRGLLLKFLSSVKS